VVRIVGVGKAPVAVDEHEIASVRSIVESKLQAEPHAYLQVGEQVSIAQGPLRGLSGILLAKPDQHRLVVGVTLLRRSVAVSIEENWAVPIDSPAARCA
jgi:transcription antitermination factor NusG